MVSFFIILPFFVARNTSTHFLKKNLKTFEYSSTVTNHYTEHKSCVGKDGKVNLFARPITVIYPVSNLIQFRIKWSYRHELHSSCSIKKQIFCMVMKSIFFSSSARSQILKTYLHAKNKSVLRDDLSNYNVYCTCVIIRKVQVSAKCMNLEHYFFYTFGSNMRSNINYNTQGKLNSIYWFSVA